MEEQKAKDEAEAKAKQEEADKVEHKRLDDLAKENLAKEEIAGKEAAAMEEKRLADKALEDQKKADSDAERLAQEAEVARSAGREPEELVLVKVKAKSTSTCAFKPSTGTWLPGKGEAHLLNDGWLENQVNSAREDRQEVQVRGTAYFNLTSTGILAVLTVDDTDIDAEKIEDQGSTMTSARSSTLLCLVSGKTSPRRPVWKYTPARLRKLRLVAKYFARPPSRAWPRCSSSRRTPTAPTKASEATRTAGCGCQID